ncbi:MAG: GC-type dockerin domain-anchored protein [Phycisphaerales bacterium JB039]
MRMRYLTAAICAAGLLVSGAPALAQTAPLATEIREIDVNSGPLAAPAGAPGAQVVFSEIIAVDGAPWLRLKFDEVRLPGSERDGTAAYLRITSFLDGGVQTMNQRHIAEWRGTSAYFNGDAVLLEILAYAGTGDSSVSMTEIMVGADLPGGADSICGPTDDRLPSSDPRAARLLPVGCTGWLINDCGHCFLTAGHCATSPTSFTVVQFNVPLSTSGGGLVHPGPEDQYAPDTTSLQSNGGQGTGDDWAYFGVFPNSTTGMSAYEKQGDAFDIPDVAPPVQTPPQPIRITGYGTTGTGVPREWNQVQKTHVGPYFLHAGTLLQYQTDTTGGNSGSPVIDDSTGMAIGIHTHAGCSDTRGNQGTAIEHPGLQAALAAPRGVCCLTPPLLEFAFPTGRPDFITPGLPTVFDVEVIEAGGVADPASGMLHVSIDGGPFIPTPMIEVTPRNYEATLPAVDCGQTVEYYVSATADGGQMRTSPEDAPDERYSTTVATGVNIIADLDFESAPGWTVQNIDLLDGQWELGDPVDFGRGDPSADYDGSGRCYLTDNDAATSNSDVDGGPTRLLSPVYDLSGLAGASISYARWFTNDTGDDQLTVEVSDNGGASWTLVESVGDSADWVVADHQVNQFVSMTSQFRVRFSATDNPNNSITEGGIDAFKLRSVECVTCRADLTGDGSLDIFDFLEFQNLFGAGDLTADFTGDGALDIFDFLAFQNEFAAGCP